MPQQQNGERQASNPAVANQANASRASSRASKVQPGQSGQPAVSRASSGRRGSSQRRASGQAGQSSRRQRLQPPDAARRRRGDAAARPAACSSRIRRGPARTPNGPSSGCVRPSRACAARPPTIAAGSWATCSSRRASSPTPSGGWPRRLQHAERIGRAAATAAARPPPTRSAWPAAPSGCSASCGAERAGRSASPERDAVGRAARDLESQRVAERMRQAARAVRDGGRRREDRGDDDHAQRRARRRPGRRRRSRPGRRGDRPHPRRRGVRLDAAREGDRGDGQRLSDELSAGRAICATAWPKSNDRWSG